MIRVLGAENNPIQAFERIGSITLLQRIQGTSGERVAQAESEAILAGKPLERLRANLPKQGQPYLPVRQLILAFCAAIIWYWSTMIMILP